MRTLKIKDLLKSNILYNIIGDFNNRNKHLEKIIKTNISYNYIRLK